MNQSKGAKVQNGAIQGATAPRCNGAKPYIGVCTFAAPCTGRSVQTENERAMELEETIAARAKENQKERKGEQPGATCQKSDNLSPVDTKREIAAIAGVSHDTATGRAMAERKTWRTTRPPRYPSRVISNELTMPRSMKPAASVPAGYIISHANHCDAAQANLEAIRGTPARVTDF